MNAILGIITFLDLFDHSQNPFESINAIDQFIFHTSMWGFIKHKDVTRHILRPH
jgi:hypothetical protein